MKEDLLTARGCLSQMYPDTIIFTGLKELTTLHDPTIECKGFVISIYVKGANLPTCANCCIGESDAGILSDIEHVITATRSACSLVEAGEGEDGCVSSQGRGPDEEECVGCVAGKIYDYTVYLSLAGAPASVCEVVAFVVAETIGLTVPANYTNPLLTRARELLKGCALNPNG